MSTNYLDLDALMSVKKTLKFRGKEHELQPVSVQAFIDNVKLVQDLGVNPTFETEVKAVVSMLLKAFPSMEESDLMGLPLKVLNNILAFAQDDDGTNEVKQAAAAEATQANPPTAG